ncbi:hypothetical protein C0J52_18093 [Blattella germanica]|nr:hypothetical protein C0J52_18093 [Blattella germanica]
MDYKIVFYLFRAQKTQPPEFSSCQKDKNCNPDKEINYNNSNLQHNVPIQGNLDELEVLEKEHKGNSYVDEEVVNQNCDPDKEINDINSNLQHIVSVQGDLDELEVLEKDHKADSDVDEEIEIHNDISEILSNEIDEIEYFFDDSTTNVVETVSNTENLQYVCGMCTTEFNSLDLLRNHALEVHAISSVLVIGESRGHSHDDSELNISTNAINITELDNPTFSEDMFEPEFLNGIGMYEEEKYGNNTPMETKAVELICEICGRQFDKLKNLEMHKYIHMDHSQWPQDCPLCHESFVAKDPFNCHLMQVHNKTFSEDIIEPEILNGIGMNDDEEDGNNTPLETKSVELMCEICGRQFDKLNNLEMHKYIHMDHSQWPLECPFCHKRFVATGPFKHHLVQVHNNSPNTSSILKNPVKCIICLKSHEKIHIPERPHSCNYCDKKFVDASELKRHILTHTGEKPHICELCGKMFRERYRLKIHMRYHTGERPAGIILRKHMRVHLKDYSCAKCGAEFTALRKLEIHEKECGFLVETNENDITQVVNNKDLFNNNFSYLP